MKRLTFDIARAGSGPRCSLGPWAPGRCGPFGWGTMLAVLFLAGLAAGSCGEARAGGLFCGCGPTAAGATTPDGDTGCGPEYHGAVHDEPLCVDPCEGCGRWRGCDGARQMPDWLAPWQMPPGCGFRSPSELGYRCVPGPCPAGPCGRGHATQCSGGSGSCGAGRGCGMPCGRRPRGRCGAPARGVGWGDWRLSSLSWPDLPEWPSWPDWSSWSTRTGWPESIRSR